MCSEPETAMMDGPPLRVMSYNILADELSSNLVPRTMEEPSKEVLCDILGADYESKWRDIDKALNDEYRKWHPMKIMVTDPQGLKMKSRGLWDQLDLTLLEGKGWKLDGVHVEDAVTLDGGKTFLGVVQQFLDKEQSLRIYRALEKVHLDSRAWEARGPRILQRIKDHQPTLLALQEYDVHDLHTIFGTFRQALEGLGYEGAVFLGPGQEKVGVGIFWLKSRAVLDLDLPEDRRLQCGLQNGSYGNIDLQEPGLTRPMDRRPFGYVKLLVDQVHPLLFCVTHLMTSSRDKEGALRKQELKTISQILEDSAEAACPVILCGDFNINLRNGAEEHIFQGTGHQRDPATKAARFHWRRKSGEDLVLRDVFDDVNTDSASSSTRTGTRLETIDYIFYDEDFLQLKNCSTLQCPEEAMPNGSEPSDHIPVFADFVVS